MTHGVSSLLIAAAAGYWVWTQAGSQKGNAKKLGQLLGVAIIAISLIGSACKIYYVAAGKSFSGRLCPPGKACPFGVKPEAQVQK
ncbi:MAG: hypothetical protein HYS41_00355 [Candidatus Omnitrophica bacterium]|nr:hypothetical protein [Candidatus Omnitrophota bacterium]